jgi:hypothetical protein
MADLLSPAASSLEALFTRFSWRRLAAMLFVLVVTALGFFFFEIYSSNLELSRLNKAATVLNTLRQIDSLQYKSDRTLASVRQTIINDLQSTLAARTNARHSMAATLDRIRSRGVAPFVAAGLIWWVLALAGARRIIGKKPGSARAFIALVVTGLLAGGVGTLFSGSLTPLAFWIVYPGASIVLIVFLLWISSSPSVS